VPLTVSLLMTADQPVPADELMAAVGVVDTKISSGDF